MDVLEDAVRYSRSARDLFDLYKKNRAIVVSILGERGIGAEALTDEESLEIALDAERRRLMHENERRLSKYAEAAGAWSAIWPAVEKETSGLPLMKVHKLIVNRAEGVLPKHLAEDTDDA